MDFPAVVEGISSPSEFSWAPWGSHQKFLNENLDKLKLLTNFFAIGVVCFSQLIVVHTVGFDISLMVAVHRVVSHDAIEFSTTNPDVSTLNIGWSDERLSNNLPSSRTCWRRKKRMRWGVFNRQVQIVDAQSWQSIGRCFGTPQHYGM